MKRNWKKWFKSHCLPATKHDLDKLKELIVMNQAELAAELRAAKAQTEKIIIEVTKLKDAVLNAGNVTPEVMEAINGVKAVLGVLDELNPDEVTPPVEPPTP